MLADDGDVAAGPGERSAERVAGASELQGGDTEAVGGLLGVAVADEVEAGGGAVLAGAEVVAGLGDGEPGGDAGQTDEDDCDERDPTSDASLTPVGHLVARPHDGGDGDDADQRGQADEPVARAPQQGLDGEGAQEGGGEAVASARESDERDEHQRGRRR